MRRYFKILTGCICFLIGGNQFSYGQINYSRFEFTPLSVNPASVAGGEYIRIGFNNRNVDLGNGVKLNSNLFNAIFPIVNKNFNKLGGIGVNFVEDQEVDRDGFRHQELNLSLAYNLNLGKQNLAFGINNSFQRNQFTTSGFTTGSQWVKNIGFDPTVSNGEESSEESRTFHSISSGLLWYANDLNRRKIFELGASVYHLNEPTVSLIEDQTTLPLQYVFFGGIRVVDQTSFSIYPVFQYRRFGNVSSVNAGAIFSYFFQNDNPFNPISTGSLNLSTRYVEDQGVSLGFGVTQRNFEAAFNYNFPVSGIDNNAFNNALEIHIVLRKPIKRKRDQPKTFSNYSIGQIRKLYEDNNDLVVQRDQQNDSTLSKVRERDDRLEQTLRFEFNEDLNFATGQAKLDLKAKNYLNEIVQLMQGNNKLGLLVIGHTDDTGDLQVNEIVSQKRAEVVRSYLVEKGVSARRIRAIGRAYFDPIVENDSPENRLKNRRVEFVLYEKNR